MADTRYFLCSISERYTALPPLVRYSRKPINVSHYYALCLKKVVLIYYNLLRFDMVNLIHIMRLNEAVARTAAEMELEMILND